MEAPSGGSIEEIITAYVLTKLREWLETLPTTYEAQVLKAGLDELSKISPGQVFALWLAGMRQIKPGEGFQVWLAGMQQLQADKAAKAAAQETADQFAPEKIAAKLRGMPEAEGRTMFNRIMDDLWPEFWKYVVASAR